MVVYVGSGSEVVEGPNGNVCILTLNVRSLSRHYDELLIHLDELEKKQNTPSIIIQSHF